MSVLLTGVCMNHSQVVVTDASGPGKFSCQLMLSQLALQLLHDNMNSFYKIPCYNQNDISTLQNIAADNDLEQPSQEMERPHDVSDGDLAEALNTTDVLERPSPLARPLRQLERPLAAAYKGDLTTGEDEGNENEDEDEFYDAKSGDDGDAEADADDEAGTLLTSDQLYLGLYCAALYDGLWYRARYVIL